MDFLGEFSQQGELLQFPIMSIDNETTVNL